MKPKSKKAKGKSFENQVAEIIHQFCYNTFIEYQNLYESFQDKKLKPRRDASSGSAKDSDGDINLGLASKYIPVSFECKHWKTLDYTLNSLIKGNITALRKIYKEQASLKKSKRLDKSVIVFKGNRTETFVFFYTFDFSVNLFNKNFVKIEEWIICSLTDFLDGFKKSTVFSAKPSED